MATIRQTHGHAIAMASEVIKTIPFSKVALKLQAISSLATCTIQKVSDVFNITDDTIKAWVRSFEKHGIAGLEVKVKNPRKPKLSNEQKEQIKLWIESDPNLTMKAVKLMIEKEFGIQIGLVSVWRNVKKMNFSHITARSVHYKQNKQKLEEFKKNSHLLPSLGRKKC